MQYFDEIVFKIFYLELNFTIFSNKGKFQNLKKKILQVIFQCFLEFKFY